MATTTPLLPLVRKFFETDAVTAARTLDGMDHEDALAVLKALSPGLVAQVFRHLQAPPAAALLEDTPPHLFKEIVDRLGAEQGAAIFACLPDATRAEFLSHLTPKAKRDIVAAGLAGAAIPLTMKAVGLDPAQSSGIILTTVTDVVGFFAFLGLAMLFQSYLV